MSTAMETPISEPRCRWDCLQNQRDEQRSPSPHQLSRSWPW